MKWRGQKRWSKLRDSATWLDKIQLLKPADLILDTEPPIEVDEIGAAAEKHVLAVVDGLIGAGMFVRRCAATEIRTPLEQRDLHAGVGQCATCREAGETASEDRYL